MEREALKIALDYVLRTTHWTEGRDRHDTLKAIKEALAQPAQPGQEPVMYGIQRADGSYGNWVWSQKSHAETDIPENPAGFGYKVIGYYTAPLAQPAQERTWVDLTDDEIDKWTPEIHGVIRAVLAQFKEKNNG